MATALSEGIRANLQALQQIAANMAVRQQRLATGRRVNEPSDGPTSYFTSSALNARASTLANVADDIGNARMVLRAASTAIDALQGLVSQARSVANAALAAPSTLATVTGTVAGQTAATPIAMDVGDTVTVSDGTTTATYTHAAGNDIQDFLDAVNGTAGLNVSAGVAGGRLVLSATGTNNIIIAGSADAGELAAMGLAAGTTSATVSAERQALAQQFDELRTQIDQLARDAGFNGVNLLGGSTLTVRFNENGSSRLTVTGSTVTAAALGIPSAAGNFQANGAVNTALAGLDAATSALRSKAVDYGHNAAMLSGRENFTREMIGTLRTGADNLVLADVNEEGASILALRAHQQLATTALSLTTRAQSSVLRLFR